MTPSLDAALPRFLATFGMRGKLVLLPDCLSVPVTERVLPPSPIGRLNFT